MEQWRPICCVNKLFIQLHQSSSWISEVLPIVFTGGSISVIQRTKLACNSIPGTALWAWSIWKWIQYIIAYEMDSNKDRNELVNNIPLKKQLKWLFNKVVI